MDSNNESHVITSPEIDYSELVLVCMFVSVGVVVAMGIVFSQAGF